MQRENKCHCSQTDRLHRIDSNYKNHTPEKCWTERENKTYKERADYLAFINPNQKQIYQAIADFFGENEIPPKIKNK